MASVWVARLLGKHGFEKLVAIKTILPKYASDMRFQHMFLDEARIASRIEHTNVAQILDLGEEKNILYLVMEWVDGDALSKLGRALEEKGATIPHGVALRILADTCGGLHAAHDLRGSDGTLLGVVHRDVSPQNVLVSTRGVAKLIDFGIAKARDRVVGETNTGILKGKIQYMAPEQATGSVVDRRADIWAVGSILYQLLAGKAPFEGANQLATLHLLTLGRPAVPIPRVHAAVQVVVRRALTHDPAKRFATALEMQAALENAMVEAKLTTTTAEVAAFCTEHIGERAITRKLAVEGSLKEAQQRARLAQLAGTPLGDSANGRTPPPISGNESLLTAPAIPGTASHPDLRVAPITETSSATLGAAAALVSPMPPAGARKRTWAIAAGAVAILGVALVATLAMRGGGESRADAAKQTTATSVPATATATASVATTQPSVAAASVDAGGAVLAESSASATQKMPTATPRFILPAPSTKGTTTAQPPRRKVDPDGF